MKCMHKLVTLHISIIISFSHLFATLNSSSIINEMVVNKVESNSSNISQEKSKLKRNIIYVRRNKILTKNNKGPFDKDEKNRQDKEDLDYKNEFHMIRGFLIIFFSEMCYINYYTNHYSIKGLNYIFIPILTANTFIMLVFSSVGMLTNRLFACLSLLFHLNIEENTIFKILSIVGSSSLLFSAGFYLQKSLLYQSEFEKEQIDLSDNFQQDSILHLIDNSSTSNFTIRKILTAGVSKSLTIFKQNLSSLTFINFLFLIYIHSNNFKLILIGGMIGLVGSGILILLITSLIKRAYHFSFIYLITCLLCFVFSAEYLIKLDSNR